ncbi:hypothetical protein BaRGS_00004166 [Batillaria attramentaria]|uniref:Uncharacterized protein n=1 Tax=Batillaria attramentaria TaxID=370345 RepID=A0ABD0LYI0_9CAEN
MRTSPTRFQPPVANSRPDPALWPAHLQQKREKIAGNSYSVTTDARTALGWAEVTIPGAAGDGCVLVRHSCTSAPITTEN